MAYSSQALIEAALKRSLTANEEALLSGILESVDSYINDLIGGSFGNVSETTRYYDGGSRILDIDTCTQITSVTLVDSEENEDSEYDLNEAFEARPRNETYKTYIEKRVGKFPYGVANIAVTAKFTENLTIPSDIEYLATYLASQLFSSQISGNLKSESIEGYSRTFGDLIENNQVVKMITEKYIKNDMIL